MIHGYHIVFGTYGFWMPNDPRGSWSDFVHSWELAKFGHATNSLDRVGVEPKEYAAWRQRAREALKYPAVTLTGEQALAIGNGFGGLARKSELGVWACSILPEHVHLVLARHRYRIEQATNLLKSEATRRLLQKNLHPMKQFQKTGEDRLPSVWGEGQCKVYLEDEEAIENAIRYVAENPMREDKPPQHWSFVTAFKGLDAGWVTYH